MGPDRGGRMPLQLFIKIFFIFLLINLFNQNYAFAELRAKGSPHAVMQVNKAGKSIGMPQAISPLSLWCQAVHKNQPTPLKLQNATFSTGSTTYIAEIMDDGVTANFTQNDVPLAEAGKWKCVLSTKEGQATGFIDVYLRPIVYSRHSIRVDHHDTAPFHFFASGITILKGENAELTCPTKGHPTPKVQWRVDGNKIIPNKHYQIVNETTLVIKNVTYNDEKTFTCISENEFIDPTSKKNTKYELFLERKVRVKSPIGWLWPLLLIIAILITLFVVISIFECHKRNKERKMIILEPEPDDE
jgi:hypothetical protein